MEPVRRILTWLDAARPRSGRRPRRDRGRSGDRRRPVSKRDAPIVIVDTRTGERWPYWAELDANATDPARQALIIRPARNFLEGHRYAVALRNLKDASGSLIAAPETFTRLAGATLPGDDPLAGRQPALRRTLQDLTRAGVSSENLYLAWDFTIASEQGLAGPVLWMRDQALGRLRGRSPQFTVTTVTDFTPSRTRTSRERSRASSWCPTTSTRRAPRPARC